jgi:hypothetical protein
MKRPTISQNNSNPSSALGGMSTFNSYQKGGTQAATPSGNAGYQPPVFYASSQTDVLRDTTKTFYQADETAGKVLDQLTMQRQQITGAHDNVWIMRQTTEKAKRELEELRQKYRQKKHRLYMWIAILSIADILLFFRILQCHGNFYCF